MPAAAAIGAEPPTQPHAIQRTRHQPVLAHPDGVEQDQVRGIEARVVVKTHPRDLREVITPEPDQLLHWLVGIGCRGKGLADEAIEAQRKAVEVSDGSAMMLGWLGLVLGAAGRRNEGGAVLERLELMARSTYVPPTSLAWACLGLRDVDGLFEWLNRAIDAHDLLMMPIKSYAFLDPLRPDPRYAALLRRMNLDK